MEKINHFFELTRLKKPIGYMLLFWPCVWGLTIAFDFANNVQIYLKYCFPTKFSAQNSNLEKN